MFGRSASIRSVSSTADVAYRHPAVPEQGCTSCERGRVVMGRLKRMIVTVSSSSRLLVSARVCSCPRDGLPCLRSNNPVFRFSFWTASYQRFCVCKNKYKSQVSAHQRLWSRERLSNAHLACPLSKHLNCPVFSLSFSLSLLS